MSSLLTVEDYNSVNTRYINEYYTLDTSKISDQEFENVLYDFCIVSHSIEDDEHTFTFEIYNSLWTGGYWFSKQNGDYINYDATFDDDNNTITFTTTESCVKLHLYLCSFATRSMFVRLEYIFEDLDMVIVTKKQLNTLHKFYYVSLKNGSRSYTNAQLIEGVLEWRS